MLIMCPESSIVESREIASGVAIAASVSEISDSSCRSDLRSVKASQRPLARVIRFRSSLSAIRLILFIRYLSLHRCAHQFITAILANEQVTSDLHQFLIAVAILAEHGEKVLIG